MNKKEGDPLNNPRNKFIIKLSVILLACMETFGFILSFGIRENPYSPIVLFIEIPFQVIMWLLAIIACIDVEEK